MTVMCAVCVSSLFVSPAICSLFFFFFFFNDTATTEIYTLSLHDALPICLHHAMGGSCGEKTSILCYRRRVAPRSEEHTSELQSQSNLVCRLLLEKKKNDRLPSGVWTANIAASLTQPIS